jgi:hypothetical protein
MKYLHLSLLPIFSLLACTAPTDDGADEGGQDGPAVTEELGDGAHETVIDATDEAAWTYFDFETRAAVTPAAPDDDDSWDLGALRFNIKSNGGTSGTGGAMVAILEGTNFDAVTAAPADGFTADAAAMPGVGGEMADVEPGYAFDNWFAYDQTSHTLAPAAGRIYVVRTPEGGHFKVEMLGYYDDAGTPGYVRFRWAALP